MSDITTGFHVIIPYYVLQSNLTHSQKILCGAIIGLSAKEGYCYASNETIARLTGIKNGVVKSEISILYKDKAVVNLGTKKSRRVVINSDYFTEISTAEAKGYPNTFMFKEDTGDKNTDTEERFDRLWAIYPIKAKKQPALQKFMKLSQKDRDSLEEMLPNAIAYHNQPSSKENFIPTMPHFLTFINQKRWLDEVYFDVEKIEKRGENLKETELIPEHIVEMIADALQDEDESVMNNECTQWFAMAGISFDQAVSIYDKKGISEVLEKIENRMRDAV